MIVKLMGIAMLIAGAYMVAQSVLILLSVGLTLFVKMLGMFMLITIGSFLLLMGVTALSYKSGK